MKTWIVPCKGSTFLIDDALKANQKDNGDKFVDWRQSNDFSVGDIVFIYKIKPEGYIRYRMEVTATKLNFYEATDKELFWKDKAVFYDGLGGYKYVRFRLLTEYPKGMIRFEAMREHGLKRNIQSVMECKNEQLLAFLNGEIKEEDIEFDSDATLLPDNKQYIEGSVHEEVMNTYERSAKARAACLESKGYRCVVCGMDFETTYGEIGHHFIHVHHIVPISSIGKEYVVDGERDLVPVCPNCHNMLHRKNPPYTIEELKRHLRHI